MDFSETGPLSIVKSSITNDTPKDDKVFASNLSKECEALAVSVSVEYRDEIDVIGPVKLLKQLFDTPDLNEDLISIAVQLVGQIFVLHSWDASQQVTPLTWLDNEMASVPELAFCYHQNGAVQGHVLLKTDKDGTPTFSPHIFQQNGLALLRFLQSECKEDPGAYWLYKSAGENEIRFFDLNHSSSDHNDSASPLPSLIHSGRRDSLFSLGNLLYRLGHELSLSVVPNDMNNCARFLRKCLTFLNKPDHLVVRAHAHEQFARVILKEAVSDTSFAPAPLFQTTSNLISLNLAAVHHVSQAIMSLRWTRQLQSPEQEDASHDRKLWNLVRLLGESYLSLGEAYEEDGQLHKVLNTVESACSMYGSMPQKFEDFSMNMSPSLQSKSHAAKQVEDLQAKSGPCDTSVGEFSSTCVFWARAWKLVGHVHCLFHTLKGLEPSDTQKLTSTNHLNMPSGVAEEVDSLRKKLLTEYSQGCASCALVNCSCKSDIASSSSSSNGIFKYLTGPKTDGTESNLLAALDCYEESGRVLQELPSSLTCPMFKGLTECKGMIFSKLGDDRINRKEMDKAEDAFADALAAYKEICDHTNAIKMSLNMGYCQRERAVGTVRNMEAMKRSSYQSAYYPAALVIAKQEYNKSLGFYEAAKKATDEASSLPDNMKEDVYRQLADTCFKFGNLLAEEESTSAAKKYFRKGLDLYESLGERYKELAAATGDELGRYLRDCCLRHLETNDFSKAKRYFLLANTCWQKSMDICGPENFPSMFFKILIVRSNLSLSVSNCWELNKMLESALSVLLQGRRIPQTDAESLSTEDQKLFRNQLQNILKKMVREAQKSQTPGGVYEKLKKLYEMSIRSTSLSDLDEMHVLWISP